MSLAVAAPTAWAIPQEYTVLAVGIATSKTKAEAYAMDYARKRAVFLATSKLGVANPEKAVMGIKSEALPQIIRGATVDKTQRVGEKTYQQIRVTIAEEPLRAALGLKADAGEKVTSTARTHSVLLIPVAITPTKTWVWEKENNLRAPLSEELLRQARGLVMLPGGDLQDLRLIDRDNATTVKAEELKPMFERYGASEIIIAAMSTGKEGTTDPTKILLHRVTAKKIRDEVIEIPPEAAEDKSEVRVMAAARAIASAATQIASSTDDDENEKLAAATKIKLRFVYTTPRELARLTETIRRAPGVLQLELPAIMLNNVSGVIYLDGNDKAALRKQLAAKAIVIRDVGDEWTASTR